MKKAEIEEYIKINNLTVHGQRAYNEANGDGSVFSRYQELTKLSHSLCFTDAVSLQQAKTFSDYKGVCHGA